MGGTPNFSKRKQNTDFFFFFFLNKLPLVRGPRQFMRAYVCGSVATETSVKHCVQFLPFVGEKQGPSGTWLQRSILHHILLSIYSYLSSM